MMAPSKSFENLFSLQQFHKQMSILPKTPLCSFAYNSFMVLSEYNIIYFSINQKEPQQLSRFSSVG